MGHGQQDLHEGNRAPSSNGSRGNGRDANKQLDIDVEIRPSRIEDFYTVCGKLPPLTSQSFTIFFKGEAVGIAGTILTRAGDIAFMNMKQDIKAPKIKVFRNCVKIFELIAQDKRLMYAGADEVYENSGKFLRMLGFKYYCTDPEGMEIYLWRN